MNDEGHSVLDLSTARAWVTFQARLGDRLAEMEDEDLLLVRTLDADPDPDAAGAVPYAQFCAWGGDLLRAEVASNEVLRSPHRLTRSGERALVNLGYAAPTHGRDDEPDSGSPNFHVDLPRSAADRLAVMTVRALRDVFGVAHPALLTADGLEGEEPVAEELPVPGGGYDEPAAVFPEGGHEQLRELVDAALVPYLGEPPEHDEDGDIPLDAGGTVLYVRVLESMPVVELFACLATDVDVERAAFEVQVLNRDVRFLKFQVLGDSIVAYLHLQAWPFAPEHLRSMVAIFSEAVERVENDVLVRVARTDPTEGAGDAHATGFGAPGQGAAVGREVVEAPDNEDPPERGEGAASRGPAEPGQSAEFHRSAEAHQSAAERAREILLHLETEAPGTVDPVLAAAICGHDADLVLRLIDADAGEEVAWREARDDALAHQDPDTAAVCEREAEHAARSVSLLRRALRVVAERDAARVSTEPPGRPAGARAGAAGAGPEAGPTRAGGRAARRPRRVPDPTLEEVDPEMWG